jgi:hypothetical protein
MLTKRQNFMETIRGGNPDRFVKQFEPFGFIWANLFLQLTLSRSWRSACKEWMGCYNKIQGKHPGPFTVHDAEHKVVRISQMERDCKGARLDYPQEEWNKFKPAVDAIDRSELFAPVSLPLACLNSFIT